MRYTGIARQCVSRLLRDGYLLGEGEKAYIDEVTMMVLQEDGEDNCTDEDFIDRITAIGRLNLRRSTGAERLAQSICSTSLDEEEKMSLLKKVSWFIQTMTGGSKRS